MRIFIIILLFFTCCKLRISPKEQAKSDSLVNSLKGSNILCMGNSLTYGAYLSDPYTQSYPAQLSRLLSNENVTVFNGGISGITTAQMLQRFSLDVPVHYIHGKRNILIVWEIGNDIYFNGGITTDYNRFIQYCNIGTQSGWEVYIINLPYRNNYFIGVGQPKDPAGDDSTTYIHYIDSINVLLKENYQSFSKGLVDLSGIFTHYDALYYFPDHVHFKDTAYSIIANEVAKVIK